METLAKTLLKAARLEASLTGETIPESWEQQLTMWGAGIFRLVVMGEIKKGKSSFINAMLGTKDLVPVSSNVATSTIFKIRYGAERGYVVHFLKESDKSALPIDVYDLNRFGTEDGNPGNREQVDFIEVLCPSPLLQSGIVIIDTPGLGGLFKAHKQITYQYVPRADAVFFVTDSVESPIGQLETEYLKDIRGITPYLYFVQTKACSVDTEARLARKRNNLSILSRCLELPEKDIPYFLVDSELRFDSEKFKDIDDLTESGYPQLMAFIRNVLQANQQKCWLIGHCRCSSPPLSTCRSFPLPGRGSFRPIRKRNGSRRNRKLSVCRKNFANGRKENSQKSRLSCKKAFRLFD